MKTTRQLAEEIGISTQAVLKRIQKLGLEIQKNNKGWYLINEEQAELIKGEGIIQDQQPQPTKQPTQAQLTTYELQQEIIEELRQDKQDLKKQLETKDRQILNLNENLKIEQNRLTEERLLHLETKGEVRRLELRESEGLVIETKDKPSNFFSRLFKRNT